MLRTWQKLFWGNKLVIVLKYIIQKLSGNVFSQFHWKLAQNWFSSILVVKYFFRIRNCREFDSKQLLYLELVVKISSYLSGNQRNFEKMSENHRKSVFFFPELVFYFSFFKVFFWIEIKFIKFLAAKRAHFFDFLLYFAGKRNFLCIKWAKIDFSQICVFFFRELVFYFSLLKGFFLDRNQVYKVLGGTACPFFRFFALLCRKIHFLLSNLAIFAKPKEILTKNTVCGRKCRTFYQ